MLPRGERSDVLEPVIGLAQHWDETIGRRRRPRPRPEAALRCLERFVSPAFLPLLEVLPSAEPAHTGPCPPGPTRTWCNLGGVL